MTRLLVCACLVASLAGCGGESSPSDVDPPQPPSDGDEVTLDNLRLRFEQVALPSIPSQPTDLKFLPGTGGEFLILEQSGGVLHMRVDEMGVELLGEFQLPDVRLSIDCGAIGMAIDPQFEQNRYVYFSMCLSATEAGVFRLTFDPPEYGVTGESYGEVIVVSGPSSDAHTIGSIGFFSDGSMWVPFGDRRAQQSQDLSNHQGALLRIVPERDTDSFGYTAWADNPFGEAPEIYAYGLRSPWRGTTDRFDRVWMGDVGSADPPEGEQGPKSYEEVNLIDGPGLNLGWPLAEGPCTENCDGLTDPVFSYDRSSDNDYVFDDVNAAPIADRVISVGAVYEDDVQDRYEGLLTDRLLFSEFCVGFVRLVQVDREGSVVVDVPAGHRTQMVAMDQAPDGYLYALAYGSCNSLRGTYETGVPAGTLWRIELGL